MNAYELGVKIAKEIVFPSSIPGPTNAYTVVETVADVASPPGSLFDRMIGGKYKPGILQYIANLRPNERKWLDTYTKDIWNKSRGRVVDLEQLYDRASSEIPNRVLPPKAWDALHSPASKINATDEYIKYNIRGLREAVKKLKPPVRNVMTNSTPVKPMPPMPARR